MNICLFNKKNIIHIAFISIFIFLFSFVYADFELEKQEVERALQKAHELDGQDGAKDKYEDIAKTHLIKINNGLNEANKANKDIADLEFLIKNSLKIEWEGYIDVIQSISKLIELYNKTEKGITTEVLLDRIGISSNQNKMTEDMDFDGNKEYFIAFNGPASDGFNIVITQKNDKIEFLKFGNSWGSSKFVEYTNEDAKVKTVIFECVGGNGAGFSKLYGISYLKNRLGVVFQSKDSYGGGISLLDTDKDGKKEIVCDEMIDYNVFYWPVIYKWDGKEVRDVTLNNSDYMMQAYVKIAKASERRYADEVMLGKGKAYTKFWKRYIEPIKQQEKIDPNLNNRTADAALKEIYFFSCDEPDKTIQLATEMLNKYGLTKQTAEAVFANTIRHCDKSGLDSAFTKVADIEKAIKMCDIFFTKLKQTSEDKVGIAKYDIMGLYIAKCKMILMLKQDETARKTLKECKRYYKKNKEKISPSYNDDIVRLEAMLRGE